MKMSLLNRLLCAIALVAVTAVITARVSSQDTPGTTDDAPPWLRYTEPGPQHDVLEHFAGKWDQKIRYWDAPGAEPETAASRCDYRWIYGGRYLVGKLSGFILGDSFEGLDVLGYDVYRGEFQLFWIDNQSTGFMLARGSYDETKRELVFKGTLDDVAHNHRDMPFRTVHRFSGSDEMVAEMYVPGPDGTMYKRLEIRSTRVE